MMRNALRDLLRDARRSVRALDVVVVLVLVLLVGIFCTAATVAVAKLIVRGVEVSSELFALLAPPELPEVSGEEVEEGEPALERLLEQIPPMQPPDPAPPFLVPRFQSPERVHSYDPSRSEMEANEGSRSGQMDGSSRSEQEDGWSIEGFNGRPYFHWHAPWAPGVPE